MSTKYFAVVLAAGNSGRMGREKARLPWLDGKSLLQWTVDTLTATGWQPLVVLGPEHFAYWDAKLPASCAVLNPDPARGKTTSLAAGVKAVPGNAERILITAVDQPRPAALYERLSRESETSGEKILVPDHLGRRGHPVVISGSFRNELFSLDEGTLGLRGWLDAHRAETLHLANCDPAWLQWNLNTPAAYEEALMFFQNHLVS
jgi:molybdenum cofactor cytidylyltransferase